MPKHPIRFRSYTEPVESTPLRLRLLNDYEVVVAGLRAVLEPYADRVRVVESDVRESADRAVELTLYDTFGQSQVDQRDFDAELADPAAGAIVVYSWNTDARLVELAIEKGCRGYLGKELGASELVERLERIAAGEVVVPEGGAAALRSATAEAISGPSQRAGANRASEAGEASAAGDWPGRREGLSLREAEVIALITQGFTNPEIAARCYISPNSLKSYIRSAYRKMGVERRAQAVRWGIDHGMLPVRGA